MLSYSMVYGMTPALWVSGSQYNVGNIVLSQIEGRTRKPPPY